MANTNNYSYWCGANVVVSVENMPILEAVGVRYSIAESKRPIYGYSSRHFDAMASGQVLVEGALLVNFVDHNYLFRAIQMALERSGQLSLANPPPAIDLSTDLRDSLANEGNALSLLNQMQVDPDGHRWVAEVLQGGWDSLPETTRGAEETVLNPHDMFGGLDISITYGDREAYNLYKGMTNTQLQSVYFLGRGQQISIDEQTLVEEYPFIARNIVNKVSPYRLVYNKEEGFSAEDGSAALETTSIARTSDISSLSSDKFSLPNLKSR